MSMMKLFMVVVILVLSISVKYVRYSSPMPDEKAVSEQIALKLNRMDWHLENTLSMNTNRTSRLMVFKKEGCSKPLYLSLTGSDASHVAIFKQFIGQDGIQYVVSDFSPDQYAYLSFYLHYLYSMMRALLGSEPMHYAPLLLMYNPYDSNRCSLIREMQQHRQPMAIAVKH